VLLSLRFWLYTIIYCCSHFCLSSLGNFLPSIIQVELTLKYNSYLSTLHD
jgi:hypothetical protein